MKTIKEELMENCEIVVRDCGCCSDELITIELVLKILKERNIKVNTIYMVEE